MSASNHYFPVTTNVRISNVMENQPKKPVGTEAQQFHADTADEKVSTCRPFVSVVTPFYNTGLYLGECIESVLRQSYSNFEYILVNNCSTDNSAQIAQEFANRDSRIRLLHNDTFRDKVDNYNNALTKISTTSKYCKIVQADDWLFEDCLEKMLALAESNPRVGLISSYFMLGNKLQNVGLPFPNSVFNGRDICRMQLLDGSNFFLATSLP